jgi:predicted acylesterase/phospholipase RssA
MRVWFLSVAALVSAACATSPDVPVNARLLAAPPAAAEEIGVEGDAIALAFSGGGARAASFSYGVLLALKDLRGPDGRRLIDRVALVTAVSGGAITAAYLGQHGPDDLDNFRKVALDKDWAAKLHTSPFWPGNWVSLYDGGLNGPDKLADWLDAEVFAHGKMRDLRMAGPRIVINATELFTGAPFAFTPTYFNAICSDLPGLRIADAVAASMAVPVAFRPIIVEAFGENCPAPQPGWVAGAATDRSAPVLLRETARAFERYRDPTRMKYLHLADGGVVDNFGLASLITIRHAANTPWGPFSQRDAVKLKRLTFIVVNAEVTITGDWPLKAHGPNGPQLIGQALDISINANKRMALDAFSGMLNDWKRDLIDYRCKLSPAEASALGAPAGWKCDDLDFRLDMISFADLAPDQYKLLGAAPTAVSLPKELIDAAIAGGRRAIEINPLVKDLTR